MKTSLGRHFTFSCVMTTPAMPTFALRNMASNALRQIFRWLKFLERCTIVLAAAIAVPWSAPAQAMEMSLSLGHAPRHVVQTELGLLWDTGYRWGDPAGWHADVYAGAYLGWWHPTSGKDKRNIVSIGASPVFRLEKPMADCMPFFEVSAGPRLMSHTAPSAGNSVATALQFAETVGAGFAFGARRQYQLGYRFEHVSNGGIKDAESRLQFSADLFSVPVLILAGCRAAATESLGSPDCGGAGGALGWKRSTLSTLSGARS